MLLSLTALKLRQSRPLSGDIASLRLAVRHMAVDFGDAENRQQSGVLQNVIC
jgi:hypothetical protein